MNKAALFSLADLMQRLRNLAFSNSDNGNIVLIYKLISIYSFGGLWLQYRNLRLVRT